MGNVSVTTERSIRFLGIDLDNHQNLNLHMRKMFKSASSQITALSTIIIFDMKNFYTSLQNLINWRNYRILCTKIFKTLNNLNFFRNWITDTK